jgi:hypothetical protein
MAGSTGFWSVTAGHGRTGGRCCLFWRRKALGAGPDDDDEAGPGLAVDEATDLKRGASTACVSPQHSGVTGKTENCVTWVFSALVTATGQCRAWFDLYVPECWAKDPARRKKAGIPRGLKFAAKPELAIARVKAVIECGVRICWVAADEVYGRSGDFRAACRALLRAGPEADAAPKPEAAAVTAGTNLDLRIHPGADTIPAVAGLPCPAGTPPVRLSDTETARIDALTRAYTGGLLSRDRLAFHFRWSHWRRRHQARARWSHYSTRLAALAG